MPSYQVCLWDSEPKNPQGLFSSLLFLFLFADFEPFSRRLNASVLPAAKTENSGGVSSSTCPPQQKGVSLDSLLLWRKRWDSNPRYISVYLISSQGRYDHFDTLPYMFSNKSWLEPFLFCGTAGPLCPVAVPEIFGRTALLQKFRPLPLARHASSATGGARLAPHFDTLPYMICL